MLFDPLELTRPPSLVEPGFEFERHRTYPHHQHIDCGAFILPGQTTSNGAVTRTSARLLKRENALPVILHVNHGPFVRGRRV